MSTATTNSYAAIGRTTGAQDAATLLGRILLAWLFIPAGWAKIGGFAGTVGYIASKGVPMPEVAAALAIAIELGLGILLLIGWQARWAAPEAQVMMQKQAFWKNLAVVGGLLFVHAFGPGGWSLDGRKSRS